MPSWPSMARRALLHTLSTPLAQTETLDLFQVIPNLQQGLSPLK